MLDPLVRKLASMLEVTTKRSVQDMAVAALAVAAEAEFTPYVAGGASLMTKLMAANNQTEKLQLVAAQVLLILSLSGASASHSRLVLRAIEARGGPARVGSARAQIG